MAQQSPLHTLPRHRTKTGDFLSALSYNVSIALHSKGRTMAMMSVRLPDDLTQQLDALAAATGRSKSFLAGQAIRDYLGREAWQVAETHQAIREADAGDFASDEEVSALRQKWAGNAG